MKSLSCFRNRIPRVRSRGRDCGHGDHAHGRDRGCVRCDRGVHSRRMKVSKEPRVRRSGSDRSVRDGRSHSTPGSDHPLIRAPVEELRRGRRVVVPQSPPRLRIVLEGSFLAPCPRAGVVSDATIQN